ncbi:hypothetical protein ACFFX0_02975 [Citricoccus parietis]|uniref:Uncharacterized protein n=1 Tax=Citricoccus parietis TaxID=592307 RepID=A0ABV5FU41_9MICC
MAWRRDSPLPCSEPWAVVVACRRGATEGASEADVLWIIGLL